MTSWAVPLAAFRPKGFYLFVEVSGHGWWINSESNALLGALWCDVRGRDGILNDGVFDVR